MGYHLLMNWVVWLSKKAVKQLSKMPEPVRVQVNALVEEMRVNGPMASQWKNFGKLKGQENCFHCHVKSGRPTYVVCWEVKSKEDRIVEVYYVGTHEKAPY